MAYLTMDCRSERHAKGIICVHVLGVDSGFGTSGYALRDGRRSL